MANQIPLIVNAGAGQIQQLATGDNLSVAGNIVTGNILTDGYYYANGTPVSFGSNYGNANVAEYLPTFTGNLAGNNINSNTISTSGNITTAGFFIGNFQGNISGNLVVPGSNTQVLYNNDGNAGASSGLTFDSASNAMVVAGNVTASNFIGNLSNGASKVSIANNGNVSIGVGPFGTTVLNVNISTGISVLGNVLASGYISATGNITGNYIFGNGSQLTGLPSAYGNTEVAAYLAGSAGNIIPGANLTYSLGNSTNWWSNVWVAGNTIYIGGVPLGMGAGNVLTVDGNAVLSNDSNTSIATTGNITANYFIGDGSQLTNLPSVGGLPIANGASNFDIATANGNPTITSDGNTWTFGGTQADALYWPDGSFQATAFVGSAQYLTNPGCVSVTTDSTGNTAYVWVFGTDGNLTLPGNTSSINYANGNPYGGGGSANTGNVTFTDQIVIGTGTNDGGGGLYLAPGNASIANSEVQYLRVRGGDYPTHIHLDTGNNQYFDQYFGADSKFVKLEANGNVVINADDYGANSASWTFDITGNVTVPGNIQSVTTGFPFSSNISGINTGSPTVLVTLVDSVFGAPETGQVTITGVVGTVEANNTWYYLSIDPSNFQLYYDQALINPVDGTTWTAYVSGGLAVALGYSNLAITGGNVSIVTNTGNTWIFGADGNLTIPNDIVSANTIDIDNRASGNSADIRLYSADDIVLQARDRTIGSTTEGGDINILAGDSAEDGDTGGGDIIIEAGRGGAGNVDIGGSGGFIRIESGQGGDAIGNTGGTAESGGSLTLRAGDAGDNNGNIDLGSSGGDVYIESGFSTGNTYSGGDIVLTTGTGGQNGTSGNVQIIIPGYGLTTGGTWTFDGTGNLTLPANTFAVNYANGTPVSIGGGANTGNITFTNTTISAPNDTDINIQALNDDGVISSGISMQPGDTYTSLEQWGSQDSNSWTTADWSTGIYTTQGGGEIGAVVFTNAPNIFNFVNSLQGVGHIYFSVNGGPQLLWDGTSSGGGGITFYTPTPPDTDPTTVTSFEYFYSYSSRIEIDYSENEEFNIEANNVDLNLLTTNQNDIELNSSRDMTLISNGTYSLTNYGNTEGIYITTDANDGIYQWTFGVDGNLTLPPINLGGGTDEQTVVQSQRKLIPSFRWSAVISGNTPTVVYTATNANTTSMKVTVQVQHSGLGMELFDVSATYTGVDTYYTVSNRVAPPTIAASAVVVDLNGSNTMQITITIDSGATTSWVTYDAVEFGIPND